MRIGILSNSLDILTPHARPVGEGRGTIQCLLVQSLPKAGRLGQPLHQDKSVIFMKLAGLDHSEKESF